MVDSWSSVTSTLDNSYQDSIKSTVELLYSVLISSAVIISRMLRISAPELALSSKEIIKSVDIIQKECKGFGNYIRIIINSYSVFIIIIINKSKKPKFRNT